MNMPPAKPTRFKSNHSTVKVTGTSTQFVPANGRRNFLRLYNTGGFIAYARFGAINQATAAGASGDVPITAGNELVFDFAVPVDGVFLIAPLGTTTIAIFEGSPPPGDYKDG